MEQTFIVFSVDPITAEKMATVGPCPLTGEA